MGVWEVPVCVEQLNLYSLLWFFFKTDGLSTLQKPTTRNRKLETGHRNQEWGNTETEKQKRGTGKTGWFVRIVQFLTFDYQYAFYVFQW